jgi:uncharacterized membrane protein
MQRVGSGRATIKRPCSAVIITLMEGWLISFAQHKTQEPCRMEKNRLEAFSDGVIAIIITIMVLELKVPHGAELAALKPLLPVFLSYGLSFVFVGIYWNNHHHMLQLVHSINGRVMWANLHWLFWLSLLPFTTGWMGENHFERWPTVLYGVNLLLCGFGYYRLQTNLIHHQGPEGLLARAVGIDWKGRASLLMYIVGIALAWAFAPWAGMALFVLVALMWLVPDRRVARTYAEHKKAGKL